MKETPPAKTFISKISPNLLLGVLSALTVILTIIPVLTGGPKGIFFSFEPDIPYVSNALSYTSSRTINYGSHPATPSIILIAKSFIPLRIYAKYIEKIPFIRWSIIHHVFLYQYVRVFEALLLGLSVALFLLVIKKVSKSNLTVLFSWMSLWIFTYFPYLGSSIISETTSFLFVSIWLVFFLLFMKSKNKKLIALLAFISGLTVANKFSNLFFAVASICLVFSITKDKIIDKLRNLIIPLIFSVAGFIIGTWPIRHSYKPIFGWVVLLATKSEMYGAGKKTLLDLPTYLNSGLTLINQETWATIIFAITTIIVLYQCVRNKSKLQSPISILTASMLIGTLIFAKYPKVNYQLINYIAIMFVASIIFNKWNKLLKGLVIIILLFPMTKNINTYYSQMSAFISDTIALETYIENHPAEIATLWEWGKTKDYSLLHSRDWAGGLYAREFKSLKPKFFNLTSDLEKINVDYQQKANVFDVCWDKLYIQQQIAPIFLSKYSSYRLKYRPIPHTDTLRMALIESNHCFK